MRAWEAMSESQRKRRKKSSTDSTNNNIKTLDIGGTKVGMIKKQAASTAAKSKTNNQSSRFRSLLRKAPKSGSLHHIGGSGSDSSASSRAGYRSRLGSSEEVRDESEMVVTSYTKPEKQRHHHHHHHRHKHSSSSSSRPKEEKFSRH